MGLTRPIYQITVNEPSKAFDDFVCVVAATGFHFVLEGQTLLVRALPANQALLDRTLTIDMKLAIYHRIALGDVKDVDLYLKMLKNLGLSSQWGIENKNSWSSDQPLWSVRTLDAMGATP